VATILLVGRMKLFPKVSNIWILDGHRCMIAVLQGRAPYWLGSLRTSGRRATTMNKLFVNLPSSDCCKQEECG
jgi:hypothetical protein